MCRTSNLHRATRDLTHHLSVLLVSFHELLIGWPSQFEDFPNERKALLTSFPGQTLPSPGHAADPVTCLNLVQFAD